MEIKGCAHKTPLKSVSYEKIYDLWTVSRVANIKTFIQIANKIIKKMIFFFNNLPLPIVNQTMSPEPQKDLAVIWCAGTKLKAEGYRNVTEC